MIDNTSKNLRRRQRQSRARNRFEGSAQRPRLNVYRSLNHIYAQVIDDGSGHTLLAVSSKQKALDIKLGGNLAAAKAVGTAVGQQAKAKGIEAVVFDRAGYPYHGRVKALAEAAREAGLKF
jgi:large subunit ribosomal protein L18